MSEQMCFWPKACASQYHKLVQDGKSLVGLGSTRKWVCKPPGTEQNKGLIELLETRARNHAQHWDFGADENSV